MGARDDMDMEEGLLSPLTYHLLARTRLAPATYLGLPYLSIRTYLGTLCSCTWRVVALAGLGLVQVPCTYLGK